MQLIKISWMLEEGGGIQDKWVKSCTFWYYRKVSETMAYGCKDAMTPPPWNFPFHFILS
jgi:hypothetical protein